MAQQPELIMNRLDVERLERLLENDDVAALPGAALLQRELERAEVREPEDMPPDVVTMNATAVCRDGKGQVHELTLSYPRDADGTRGRISVLAPLGSALLGMRKGDSMAWPGPDGTQLQCEVLDITYQPEAAGELHR